jgi:hypothetical protein
MAPMLPPLPPRDPQASAKPSRQTMSLRAERGDHTHRRVMLDHGCMPIVAPRLQNAVRLVAERHSGGPF